MPKIEIPEKLKCPITHELFKDPVIAQDGHTYERIAITAWVNKNGTSPKTREKITAKFIPITNWDKRGQVSRFLDKAKVCSEEQFFAAVKSGAVEQVKQLNYLASHLEAKDKSDDDGNNPLHWAAWSGHDGMVKLLLAEKANIEAKNNYGNTPLHWAAWSGHDSVVKLLLAEKANIEAKNNYGYTPLHWAAWNGHDSVVKLLLAEKANIEAKNNDGNTPLHLAAENGKGSVIKLLLEKGANYKAINNANETPAQLTIKQGKHEIAALIPAYHQKLKHEAKIAELEQVIQKQAQHIEQQERRIQQLEQQLQQALSRLSLDPANQPSVNTASPAFFKGGGLN